MSMYSDHEMDELLGYYNQGGEEQRLVRGIGQLEFARTQEILRRYLPPPPAIIYDIGGGTGIYARWLAGLGYTVHLFDLTPGNIAIAQAINLKTPVGAIAACEVADAGNLDRPDGSADVVLLMGPLYHLVKLSDRL